MDSEGVIRIAVVTTLYPNSCQPRHGVFVEERLRKLVATGRVVAHVIAPVPWFPFSHAVFGHYATLAAVPRREKRHGITIDHPRYPLAPKIGMTLAPASLARCVGKALEQLRRSGFQFDLIDAHYVYPDGVAAVRAARKFGCPVVITARGADMNSIANMRRPRAQIKSVFADADALIGVSQSLSTKLQALAPGHVPVKTLRNGVDLTRFRALDRDATRALLGVQGALWLCVGHLIERKGVHIALEALSRSPEVMLAVVGDGPLETSLREQADRLGVAERVRFVGAVDHDALPAYYSAADALILPARSEGMPNVVLEAIACGTLVLATAVDGIPDIVQGLPAGVLVHERTGSAFARAWSCLEAATLADSARDARRRYALDFSWDDTTQGQLSLFDQLVARKRSA